MTLNFNTAPYYDDYAESDKFYKILYRPGYPVQARELTQMQSILQNQIARHGAAIFKQGAMVIPGQMNIDVSVDYVKVQNTYSGSNVDSYINDFLGKTVTGTSGVQGIVFYVQRAVGADPNILYIKYTRSATDTTTKTFSASEVISSDTYSVTAAASTPTGFGSFASIQKGVYFVNGSFVLVEEQKLILDKFGVVPSYRIGLRITEEITTPEDNEKLLDNAQGSYNYAAPGAHRHYIELVLDKIALDSTDDVGFINLATVDTGIILRDTRVTEYSDLEKTLARRTNDESGSYTVRNFEIDVREYRNNNRGAWVTATPYIAGDVVTSSGKTFVCITQGVSSVAPTATLVGTLVTDGALVWEYNPLPEYNRGVNAPLVSETTLGAHNANEAKLSIGLEPGKAFVQGYEIEKIATEYVALDKARTTIASVINNATIPTFVGNYVLVSKLFNIPTTFGLVNLYDRYNTTNGSAPASGVIVGTARIRGLEFHSGTPGATGVYKMFLFDIKMNAGKSFERNVKSFHTGTFSANIDPFLVNLVGSISTTTTAGTGVGTSFQTDLQALDVIRSNGFDALVASIASQTALTLDAAFGGTVTGQAYQLVTTKVYEPLASSLVFPVPFYAVSSISDIVYTVYEALPSTTSSAGGVAVFTYAGTGTLSSVNGSTNYTIFANGIPQNPSSMSIVGSVLTVNGVTNSVTCTAIAAIQYTGSAGVTEKTKTLASQTTNFTTGDATNTILILDKADGFKLARVEMDTVAAFGGSPTWSSVVDITDRYDFFNGQTDSYYGPAYLKLKSSYAPPTNPIRVVFQYFNHGTGHFFSKNSYAIDYKKIPSFKDVNLRDCLDFRPRLDTGTSMSGTQLPKRGVNITSDIVHYLPRKDLVAIGPNGQFFITKGAPDLVPKEPEMGGASMVLYGLTLEPFTFGTKAPSVNITRNDNKRYTMRDIGKLEKRISTLEYYTSLSLLEQETESLRVVDANGLARFKNGFVVDSFKDNSLGDITSPDYSAAIDIAASELRPYFTMRNVNLIEEASSDPARAASNYKMYGDVVTLPLDATTPHVVLVNQPFATRTMNINPFAVFTYIGQVGINPSSDDWFEVNRLPDLVQNVEGNFSALTNALATSGVLGTVWNSWQTQWTGTPVVTTWSTPEQAWFQTETTETTTVQVGQTRTGITTAVQPNIVTTNMGDRVLASSAIPFIRSRNILIQVKKLKPNTRFYPYFDQTDISSYCTGATRVVYTLSSAKKFDTSSNVGGNQTQAGRLINGDSQHCLNRGDLATFSSGATAVVVGDSITAGVRTLDVVNVKGTIGVGNTITGSVQDAGLNVATGTVVSVTGPTNLVSNALGDLNFIFNIPNSDAIRFRTGTRELKLVDTNNVSVVPTSRGSGMYNAKGILETRQTTIQSTRNGIVSQTGLTDNQTLVQTSDRVIATGFGFVNEAASGGDGGGGSDPLAQTFYVQNIGGCFLSKVDIFFARKDANIPVTLEIREVINGYPGAKVLPFSRVTLNPDQVNISGTTVLVDGEATPTWDTPTTFEFPSPVYVADGAQYAIVLLADTQGYEVWISQVGELIAGTDRSVSTQPNLGSLFKSQNASTWTPDQNQDLMFKLYRAKFNVGTVGSPTQGLVRFVNDELASPYLGNNPFEVRSGLAKVRVHMNDHGLAETSSVTIQDFRAATGTITATTGSAAVTGVGTDFNTNGLGVGSAMYNSAGTLIGTVLTVNSATSITLTANGAVAVTAGAYQWQPAIAGIPAVQIFKTHTSVANVQRDSFVISTSTTATSTGYLGGSLVRSTQNVQFSTFQPSVQVMTFPETSVGYQLTAVSGKSVNSTQTPYIVDASASNVAINENNFVAVPKMICSKVDEAANLAAAKSLKFDIRFTSSNNALSPIIDTDRTSFVAITNRVNAPTVGNMNVATLDQTQIVSNTLIQLLNKTVFSVDAATIAILAGIAVGRELVIAGAATGGNNGSYIVAANDAGTITVIRAAGNFTTQASGASTITLSQNMAFVDEITPTGSSSLSKYVTKRVNLENASTFLRIRLAANTPIDSSVEVYYRTNPSGATTDLTKTPWTLATPTLSIPVVAVGDNTFFDTNYSVSGMVPFDAISVKVVLKSANSAAVPRVKDLRIIACA